MSSTKHGHADIVSYLASSDSEMLQRLYTDEFTSLTVFRSLRGLAKQYVMNLVLLDNAVWEEVVDKWTLDTSNSHHKAAMYKLKKYKILQSQLQDKQVPQSQNKHQLQQRRPKTKKENIYWLNADFKRCLRNVLLSNATNQIQDIHIDISSLSANAQSKLQSSESIIVFGDTKWDNVLRTIGNVEELEPQAITNRDHLSPLQTLLENVKLLKIDRHDGNILKVTPEGFKFLFQDIHTQIWQMIVAYLDTCESRKLSKLDIIKFLFKLSFLTPGKVYSRENLTKDVIVLIDDLIHFGLVWVCFLFWFGFCFCFCFAVCLNVILHFVLPLSVCAFVLYFTVFTYPCTNEDKDFFVFLFFFVFDSFFLFGFSLILPKH